jgi:phosphotransferase system HPr-like phosphotransfer protein
MIEFVSLVKNKIGVHLRAAGEFVKVASQYSSGSSKKIVEDNDQIQK